MILRKTGVYVSSTHFLLKRDRGPNSFGPQGPLILPSDSEADVYCQHNCREMHASTPTSVKQVFHFIQRFQNLHFILSFYKSLLILCHLFIKIVSISYILYIWCVVFSGSIFFMCWSSSYCIWERFLVQRHLSYRCYRKMNLSIAYMCIISRCNWR